MTVLDVCDPLRLARAQGVSPEGLVHEAARAHGAFLFQPVTDVETGVHFMSAARLRLRSENGDGPSIKSHGADYLQYSVYLIPEQDWIEHSPLLTLTLGHWLKSDPDLLRDYRTRSIRPWEMLDLDALSALQSIFPLESLPPAGSAPWKLLELLDPPFMPHRLSLDDGIVDGDVFALRIAFVVALLPKPLRMNFSFCANLALEVPDLDLQYVRKEIGKGVSLGNGREGALSGLRSSWATSELKEWEQMSGQAIVVMPQALPLTKWTTLQDSNRVRGDVLEALLKGRLVEPLDEYLSGLVDALPVQPDNVRFKSYWCERISEYLEILIKFSRKRQASAGSWCHENALGEWEMKLDPCGGGGHQRRGCFSPERVLQIAVALVDESGNWLQAWKLVYNEAKSRGEQAAILCGVALRAVNVGDESEIEGLTDSIPDYAQLKKLYCLIDKYVGFSCTDEAVFTRSPNWRKAFFGRLETLYSNTSERLVTNPYNLISASQVPFAAVKHGMVHGAQQVRLINRVAEALCKRNYQNGGGAVVGRRLQALHEGAEQLVQSLDRHFLVREAELQSSELMAVCLDNAITSYAQPGSCNFWRAGFVFALQSHSVAQEPMEACIGRLFDAWESLNDKEYDSGQVEIETVGYSTAGRIQVGTLYTLSSSVLHNFYRSGNSVGFALAILDACTVREPVRMLGCKRSEFADGRLRWMLTRYLEKLLYSKIDNPIETDSEQCLELADAIYFYVQDYIKSSGGGGDLDQGEMRPIKIPDNESFVFVLNLGKYILEQLVCGGESYKNEFLRIFQIIERYLLRILSCNEKSPDPWIVEYSQLLKRAIATWAKRDDPWLEPIEDLRSEVVRGYLANALGMPMCRYYGMLAETASKGTDEIVHDYLDSENERLLALRGAIQYWKKRHDSSEHDLFSAYGGNRGDKKTTDEWLMENLHCFMGKDDEKTVSLLGSELIYVFSIVARVEWQIGGRDPGEIPDNWKRAPRRIRGALLDRPAIQVWEMQLAIEATRYRLGFCGGVANLFSQDEEPVDEWLLGEIVGIAEYFGDGTVTMVDAYDDEVMARFEAYLLLLVLIAQSWGLWKHSDGVFASQKGIEDILLPDDVYQAVREVALRTGSIRHIQAYDQVIDDCCG